MKSDVVFSRKSDEWETPQVFFDALDREFGFTLDGAATPENTQCSRWFTDAMNAHPWREVIWLNPPYSQCREFIGWAAGIATRDGGGNTVVCLVPARTDTRWWHQHIYDEATHQWRPGVEVRFIRGRLKFGGAENGAPFPSCVVIFRPPQVGA